MAYLRGSIESLARRLRESLPVAVQVLAVAAGEIVEQAKIDWPVKTGRSRAALTAVVSGERIIIRDRVPYATVIVSRGVNPWNRYIVAAVRGAAKRQLPQRIGRALLRALRVSRGR